MKSNEEVLAELKKRYPYKEYHVVLCTDSEILATAYKSTPKLCREFAKRMAFRWNKYSDITKFKAKIYHYVNYEHRFMYIMPIEL